MGFTVKRFKDYIYNELNNESRTRHMNDRAIQFEDAEGRKIKISPDEGVQVEDSAGTIIHDTPDCIVAADMSYGGHTYFKDAPNYIDYTVQSWVNGDVGISGYTSVITAVISSAIPSDLTNINAALLSVSHSVSMAGSKTKEASYGKSLSFFSKNYGSSGTIYNFMGGVYLRAPTLDAHNARERNEVWSQCVAPITWSSGYPYITYNHYAEFGNMTTQLSDYSATVTLYLQGFLV